MVAAIAIVRLLEWMNARAGAGVVNCDPSLEIALIPSGVLRLSSRSWAGVRGVREAIVGEAHFVTDLWVLTKRSIARIRREPETLADVTFMPVIFILMFAYVFGGAIALPGGGSYHEYLIGGMLGMGLAQTAPGVATALVTDMSTGLMDRFRSLPMSRWAVLVARSVAELLTQLIGAAIVVCVGLAIGWRVHTGPVDVPLYIAYDAEMVL